MKHDERLSNFSLYHKGYTHTHTHTWHWFNICPSTDEYDCTQLA